MKDSIEGIKTNHYGVATEKIKSIIFQARKIEFQTPMVLPEDKTPGKLKDVSKILENLHVPQQRFYKLTDCFGTIHDLEELLGVLDDGWASTFLFQNHNSLFTSLRALAIQCSELIKNKNGYRRLIIPPLWPMKEHSNVCGEIILDHVLQKTQTLDVDISEKWRILISDLENIIWSAFEFEIVKREFRERRNPFEILIDIFVAGKLPIQNNKELIIFNLTI